MACRTLPPIPELWTVILAAGASTRLGHPKQLARWHGRSLLQRAVDAAAAVSVERTVVVLGADALRLRAHLRRCGPARAIVNPAWQCGMSTSLRCGVKALPASARGVLVLLSDQPLVDAHAVESLARAWGRRPNRVVAAEYAGAVGVPAIFPRREFRALAGLTGDKGAREVLRNSPHIVKLAMSAAACDVDTPRDLENLARRSNVPRRRE